MNLIQLTVNGEPCYIDDASTCVLDVISKQFGVKEGAPGVAVAVNGELVPRGGWATHRLKAGDALELVHARQGG